MNTSVTDQSSLDALAAAYAAARAFLGPGQPIVLLHIGPEQTLLAAGEGAQWEALHPIPLGAERTAREHFRTTPPTPLALENAIATVEDHVVPLRAHLPRGAQLFTRDAGLREIATLSGAAAGQPLTLEAMERCFDTLTVVASGAPAGRLGLPADNAFAARLLILREFMHHMQFDALHVLVP